MNQYHKILLYKNRNMDDIKLTSLYVNIILFLNAMLIHPMSITFVMKINIFYFLNTHHYININNIPILFTMNLI